MRSRREPPSFGEFVLALGKELGMTEEETRRQFHKTIRRIRVAFVSGHQIADSVDLEPVQEKVEHAEP